MLVSIVIPCYNYGRYIRDCIKSCLAQDYNPIEIVVYDDVSTDNSAETIRTFANPNIVFIQGKENRGVAHARNEAIRASRGEQVAVLDADDMLMPGSIRKRVEYLATHRKISLVYGYALKVRGDYDYSWCIQNMATLSRHKGRMNNQTLMFRRDVFKRYGLYYEPLRSKEDKELVWRLGVHETSPLPRLILDKKLDENLAFYRRHPLAKHKMRKADPVFEKQTLDCFDARITDLKRHGITTKNTVFL